jgi:hypothetical protein
MLKSSNGIADTSDPPTTESAISDEFQNVVNLARPAQLFQESSIYVSMTRSWSFIL